jgi:hypothetical protein
MSKELMAYWQMKWGWEKLSKYLNHNIILYYLYMIFYNIHIILVILLYKIKKLFIIINIFIIIKYNDKILNIIIQRR